MTRTKYRYIETRTPVTQWLVVSHHDSTKKLDWKSDWSIIFKIIDNNGGISQSDNGYKGWIMFEDEEDSQICKDLIEKAGYKVEFEVPNPEDIIIKTKVINLYPKRYKLKWKARL